MKLILFLTLFCCVRAESVAGRITEAIDGDTLVVFSDSGGRFIVHLHGVAAPLLGQPYGVRAKEELRKFTAGMTAEVIVYSRLSDVEVAGVVFAERARSGLKTNVNIEMITRGFAWYDVRSGVVKEEDFRVPYRNLNLVDFEQEARKARRGLWADKKPIPPWEWEKEPNQTPAPTAPSGRG